MRRILLLIIMISFFSLFSLSAGSVLFLSEGPERLPDWDVEQVMAFVENGITETLFDSGYILFIESSKSSNLSHHWDRARLMEERIDAGAEYLLAIKIVPRERGEGPLVKYHIQGSPGEEPQRGELPLKNDESLSLEEICRSAGELIAEKLKSSF